MAKKRASPKKPRAQSEKEQGQRGVLTRVTHEGWRALSLLAIERDTSLQALAIEAFNDLLTKYGKRGVVKGPLRDQD
jgi:hypothetical protein